jgi:hypothetical protein
MEAVRSSMKLIRERRRKIPFAEFPQLGRAQEVPGLCLLDQRSAFDEHPMQIGSNPSVANRRAVPARSDSRRASAS